MIRLEDLALPAQRRGGGRDRAATLSCAVPTGAFRWLTGPPASGKSFVIGVLSASVPAASGRVSVLGTDLRRASRRERARLRRRVGVIRDTPSLVAELTLGDNIVLPLALAGRRARAARGDAAELADWLGFAGRLGITAEHASRGERQLCAVARAVAARPALLLADEPSLGLADPLTTRVVLLLAELNRLGTTVIVATADAALTGLHEAPRIGLGESGRALVAA